MVSWILKKILGSKNQREIKRLVVQGGAVFGGVVVKN